MLLAKTYNPEKNDPTNWWISEKLDGVRVFWKDGKLNTRTGKEYNAPEWFKEELSKVAPILDGELWLDRGQFNKIVSTCRKKVPIDEEWKKMKYYVFDIPPIDPKNNTEPYEKRMKILETCTKKSPYVVYVKSYKCKGHEHLLDELKIVESYGGEGLMLRKPESLYEFKRSSTLLKVKTFTDREGVVIGYVEGKGKYKGMTGSLTIKAEDGIEFNCGTGLNDERRKNPPKVGAVVTYRYFELTKKGVPRFPVFVCERDYE